MNRSDLQQLAGLRIKEAKVLLDNSCYEGAYYLAGYAVECALKACIAKKTNQHDFPDRTLVKQIYTHNLSDLIRAAGLDIALRNQTQASKAFDLNWALVKDWSEEFRYQAPVNQGLAQDLYSAITDASDGVLTWLKNLW